MAWGGHRPNAGRKARPASKTVPATVGDNAPPHVASMIRALPALLEASRQQRRGARTAENNPFRLPIFPSKAMPPSKRDQMALDENLSWAANTWEGAGAIFNGIAAEGLAFPGYAYLAELAQRAEYRILAETIADDATRKWIKFEIAGDEDTPAEQQRRADAGDDPDEREKRIKAKGKDDKVRALKDYLDRLEARDHLFAMCRDEGYFGRMHLYLGIGADRADQLGNPELAVPIGNGRDAMSKGKVSPDRPLTYIKTIEPVWTYPMAYNASNPLRTDWYNPQQWYVMGTQIHSSRIIPMVSRPVPDLLKPAYSFGGLALSQIAEPYINIWLQTRQSVAELIHSFSVMVLMTDVETLAQPNNSGNLIARAMMFNALRDNQGLMVINKATEDFKNVAAQLSGLDSLQAQAQEHVASIARIPLVKYTGLQPKGLNASSEGEIAVYDDTIGAYQNRTVRPILSRLVNFAQLSLWGEIDPGITFEFEKLREISQKEQGENEKAAADRDKVYVDMGALAPAEVRRRIINDTDLPYADLNPDDVPDLAAEEEEGLQPEGGHLAAENDNADGGKEAGAQDAKGPFDLGADADFNEADHPRAPDGKFGEGSGGKSSKNTGPTARATKPDKSAESSTEAGDPEVEFKTKKEHAGHLLERGTTAKELMETLGWPSISVPATARSLGMNLTKVKEGRTTKYIGTPMTAAERKAANLPPEGIKRSGGPASRPLHTFSLLQYIASRGGIDPKDPLIGDVRSVFGTKNLFVPGFGSLIRPNGMKLDTLREAVVEAGYIQDKGFNHQNVEETSTIRDLLDAMDTENRGDRIYQFGQAPEGVTAKQQEEVDEENLRHHDEQLDDALDYAGIDRHSVDGRQRQRVLEIMHREGISDPLEALEQEAMEWVTHASETGEVNRLLDTIPGWDVPPDADPAPHSGRTNAPVERP